MANTERIAVLEKVQVAKKEVNTLRADNSITEKDRELLEQAYTLFDEVEDDLILQEIGDHIDALKAASVALGKVTAEMSTDVKEIQKVIDLVDDAAQALNVLAKISATVITAGIP